MHALGNPWSPKHVNHLPIIYNASLIILRSKKHLALILQIIIETNIYIELDTAHNPEHVSRDAESKHIEEGYNRKVNRATSRLLKQTEMTRSSSILGKSLQLSLDPLECSKGSFLQDVKNNPHCMSLEMYMCTINKNYFCFLISWVLSEKVLKTKCHCQYVKTLLSFPTGQLTLPIYFYYLPAMEKLTGNIANSKQMWLPFFSLSLFIKKFSNRRSSQGSFCFLNSPSDYWHFSTTEGV